VLHSRFFNQSKYTSFQRQLNLYGFHRVSSGPDKNSYYHPLFLRGRPDLCRLLLRTRVKGGPSCSGEDLLWQYLCGSSLVESVPRVATPTTFDALPSLLSPPPLGVVTSSTASLHQTDLTCVSEDDTTGCRCAGIAAATTTPTTTTPRVELDVWPPLRSLPLPDATTAATTNNNAEFPMFPDLSGSSYHPGLLTSSHMAEILMGDISPYQENDVAIIHDPSQQQQSQPHIQGVSPFHSTNLPSSTTPNLQSECIPWLAQSANPAFIPSTEDLVRSDNDNHDPQFHDAHELDGCRCNRGGGYENGAVGFFEGQTFRCMDDECLRAYESKIIGA
jgi:HSF-type DNA-binding